MTYVTGHCEVVPLTVPRHSPDLRTRCGAKEHWIANDQRSPLIRFRLFGQRSPLASKLFVLMLGWSAVPLRKVFAFRRVGAELFGSRLHVKPPSHRSGH